MKFNEKSLYIFWLFSCSLFLIAAFSQREFLMYRDFSILWHGGLLVSEGYSPWKDFIMPVSPISIYLTGLILLIFPQNWLTFQLFQSDIEM